MAAMTPVLLCLQPSGVATARRVAVHLGCELHGLAGRIDDADHHFNDTIEHIQTLFIAGRPLIGVCAAGILIRAVGPLLGDKHSEPPVLAMSEDGRSIVPLLGGHHGANRLALDIADLLGGHAALTTAGTVALEEPPAGWRLANPEHAKPVMAALLQGAAVDINGPLPEALHPAQSGAGPATVTLVASERPVPGAVDRLVYHPACFALGLGCARDCPPDEMLRLVEAALREADIAAGALAGLFTIDLKADEPAMHAVAARFGLPLRLLGAATLEAETPRLANPSDIVFAEVGCHGVAEAAALAAAGRECELVVAKRKSVHATCAIARAPQPITELAGRRRGRVALIGIGPGQASWRTPEASRLIAEADELVGYGLYLNLLGPLARGKTCRDFPLGGEEDRCRYALERAGEGQHVALICSGDAGIYAMGALVLELLDRGDIADAARRVEVITAPGISALQAAAARAGAPLGHDFCAISLSDLLTPWATIERRIRAAAEGDFVIAFYNPVSKRRRTQLARARAILLDARPESTPVVLASNLGRADELIRFRSLAELAVDEVDMLTLVLVGSTQTRALQRGDGTVVYTPRGYAEKAKGAAKERGAA